MSERFFTPQWRLPAGLRAAFTLRSGGNLATHVGDNASDVAANRVLLGRELQLPGEPHWLNQVHGTRVVTVDTRISAAMPPTADGIVTRHDAVLAIQVADCLPVLMTTHDGARYGAAHAGWRGLAAGVLENTVSALAADPAQLDIWLGPCIRQAAFEVGPEVVLAFGAAYQWAFQANNRGRWQCDLAGIAAARLQAIGARSVNDCGLCTYTDAARFFSHRRDAGTLGNCGRMAALLWRTVSS